MRGRDRARLVSRAAGWLLLFATLLALLAMGSGALLVPDFRALLEQGAGAAPGFRGSAGVKAHRWFGLAAALACLPVAATGLLLGLHGLLAAHGPRFRAAFLGVLAPILLAAGLGAAFTGYAVWDRTHLSELQVELLDDFLRVHALSWGGSYLLAVALFGGGLVWLRRAEEPEEED